MKRVLDILQLVGMMILAYKELLYITNKNYKYTIIYIILNICFILIIEKLKEAIYNEKNKKSKRI